MSGRSETFPTVVMAPGLLCDARIWAEVETGLQTHAFHVDLDAATTMDEMAEVILAAPFDRFALAGFSMGAMAALLAAARAPDRITALAILSTHGERDTPERIQARRRQIDEVAASGLRAFVSSHLLPIYFERPEARRRDCNLVLDMAEAKGPAVFRAHVEALIERPDMAAAARAVQAPCHVLTGEDDPIASPALARRLADAIPGAALHVLAQCGHLAPLDRPAQIARLLNRLVGSTQP